VKLVGINADYRAVLLVKRADFPEILASEGDLVVELVPGLVRKTAFGLGTFIQPLGSDGSRAQDIPVSQSSKLGAWKVGDWTEVKAPKAQVDNVKYC
jgi:hypothetical protein